MNLTIPQAIDLAVHHHQNDRLAEAEAIYRRILDIAPGHAEALHLLGLIARRRGDAENAATLIAQAVARLPHSAVFRHNLALVHLDAGRSAEAMEQTRLALALDPTFSPALFNLALRLADGNARDEAMSVFRRLLGVRPDHADAILNLGVLLRARNRIEDAIGCYRRLLSLDPASATALGYLGMALHCRSLSDEAAGALRRSLFLNPDNVPFALALGSLLVNAGRLDEAAGILAPVAARHPRHLDLRMALCQARLPHVFDSAGEMAAARALYRAELESLAADVLAEPPRVDPPGPERIQFLPYYLPYQGGDDRALQATYGAMIHRIMASRYPGLTAPPTPPLAPGERIRVGIVSAFFCRHSNWKIPIRGWVEGLDRRRFAIHAYMVGTHKDDVTAGMPAFFDTYVEGPKTRDEWIATIRDDRLHVLIFPETGMDGLTLELAALPLAARQCVSWGHPNTSGLPTIGHFLSSDLMEPPDGDAFYTERLVRLPNLSILYGEDYNQPPATALPDIATAEVFRGLRPDAFTYLCLQNLAKYLPQHDATLARVARAVPGAQFVFLSALAPDANERVLRRLRAAFAAQGADPAAVVMLPRLATSAYIALQRFGHVFLDSIGWSGCNSSLEALNHDLPLVTLPGRFMRERHTLAILRMMGVTDTVARDADDYVRIAVRLATDPAWRAAQSGLIRERRHRVHGDRSCVEALERFLEACAAGDPP